MPSDPLSVAIQVATRLRDAADDVDANCGIAMLFDELDRIQPGHGWALAAKDKLAGAIRVIEQTGNRSPRLYNGIGTLGLAAWRLSRGGTRYQQVLAEVDRWVVDRAAADGRALLERPRGRAFHVFDVVSGLTGIGAYLLCRPSAASALEAVLTGLVAICAEQDGLPNWHATAETMSKASVTGRAFPDGMLNCGLAHGIPGPLALLSLAKDVSVPGQLDAIDSVATWLAAHRADDEWGPNWPAGFPLDLAPRLPAQNAWCYGSPGVANALWLAGEALDDDGFRKLAVETMAAVFRRPAEERYIDHSPGLCHGVAGLLMITLRFVRATGLFKVDADALARQLVTMYDPARRYGYEFLGDDGTFIEDRPEFLDGAAGVALALLAATTDQEPAWDRMLLLS
ncbi:hypothetical protein DMH04_36690 [Kibdelosporangium aridum]|uniref:Lanthionine synthetase C-like protein n=1 Tax=Kibdelosporangium aridum TaxID=2030 RepID=A0A428YZC3_KIBAR|nr:lanthionine synthetase C family protein [Kibdelosporangium aridum]RSM76047.1 hypothetical protein DMH04_36690 [Kibdelosporangium aridum]